MVNNNVNSSQLKRKRETIKLENIVILTSLSTIISVCLLTKTLKTHELKKIVLWYSCQLCSSGEQNFIGEYMSFMTVTWCSTLTSSPNSFFFLEGVVEGKKEEKGENRKGGGRGKFRD